MKQLFVRMARPCVASVFALLASSCAVTGGGGYGYGYDSGVSIGIDYSEPFEYGGWGPGYGVAPFHGGYRRGGGDGDRGRGGRPHAFRPPSAGRAMPSLPSQGHGRPGGGGSHRR